jgi:hypothetical protein
VVAVGPRLDLIIRGNPIRILQRDSWGKPLTGLRLGDVSPGEDRDWCEPLVDLVRPRFERIAPLDLPGLKLRRGQQFVDKCSAAPDERRIEVVLALYEPRMVGGPDQVRRLTQPCR